MKRREFLTAAAGVTAGAALSTPAMAAAKRPPEKRSQVYKCAKCATIVEVLVPGRPTLVHCGEPMELLEEETAPAAENKHVPVIEKINGGYKVKVGSTAHPMTEDHYIAWIDLIADGKTYRQYLEPGGVPQAVFMIDAKKVAAREFCNLHGLWKDS